MKINNNWRFKLASAVGKLCIWVTTVLGKSGASALPGLLALKIDQDILTKLSRPLGKIILITGTNGKTTSARLLASYLTKSDIVTVHNRTGSNLERGLVSTLLANKNKVGKNTWAVFEVDEAAFCSVLPKVKPNIVIISNLFRDQMDRYGEIDSIKSAWVNSLQKNPVDILILNADDPSLSYLGSIYKGKDKNISSEGVFSASDSSLCPICSKKLIYAQRYYSHQGIYHCSHCDFKNKKTVFSADKVLLSINSSTIYTKIGNIQKRYEFLPGLYNVYNFLSIFTFLSSQNLLKASLFLHCKSFQPAFGRGESININSKHIKIFLIKNPTGFNQVIKQLVLNQQKLNILIAINDNLADGRDISWLWDVNFKKLLDKTSALFISGSRASDMALRAKYSGFKKPIVEARLINAFSRFFQLRRKNLYILPTYTALLALKKYLTKAGLSVNVWEE